MQANQHTSNSYALAFINGREEGFNYFFSQYYPALCYFAHQLIKNREAAEDIGSHAFSKTWAKHAQFDNEQNIRAYLYRVVRNDCYNWLKQKQRIQTLQNELVFIHGRDQERTVFDSLVSAEVLREIFQAFERLPPQCRQVFNLLYIQGKTMKEAAEELDVSASTVKTQKARGLAVIRKLIK